MKKEELIQEAVKRELEKRHKKEQYNFMDYVKYMFEHERQEEWQDNWHYHEIAQALKDAEEDKINRIIINVPPGSAKTEMITKMFPSYRLGKHPKEQRS